MGSCSKEDHAIWGPLFERQQTALKGRIEFGLIRKPEGVRTNGTGIVSSHGEAPGYRGVGRFGMTIAALYLLIRTSDYPKGPLRLYQYAIGPGARCSRMNYSLSGLISGSRPGQVSAAGLQLTEPATGSARLWRMPHDGAAAKRQLRKAEVENFPILRSSDGRMRKVVKGKPRPISEQDARRIKALVIPPAWRDVRISADPRSHIQAVGRDEAGRRQYIYHGEWEAVRSAEKGERLRRLIRALPRIRRRIARDLDQPGDPGILATAARLVDRLCLRAGHEEYAGEESGRGAATLLCKHVRVSEDSIEFDFPGKGKRRIVASLIDTKAARNIEGCRKIRGRRLFKLRSGRSYRNMTASDLNAYLAKIAKCEISAKDFRTLRASSLAIADLAVSPEKSIGARRRALAKVCRDISTVLCNTPAVVRKSYVHSPIVTAYEQGQLAMRPLRTRADGCSQGERLLLAFLRKR